MRMTDDSSVILYDNLVHKWYDSGKLPTHPSPNATFGLSQRLVLTWSTCVRISSSGKSRVGARGAQPPLIFRPKNFFGWPPPPLPSLSQGLDPPLLRVALRVIYYFLFELSLTLSVLWLNYWILTRLCSQQSKSFLCFMHHLYSYNKKLFCLLHWLHCGDSTQVYGLIVTLFKFLTCKWKW